MIKILTLILSLSSCAVAPIIANSGADNINRGKPFGVLAGVFLVSTGVFVYLYLRKRKEDKPEANK